MILYTEEDVELVAQTLWDECRRELRPGGHLKDEPTATCFTDARAVLAALSSSGRLVPPGSEVREGRLRPAVRIEPSMRFGAPHIKGISTEAITGMLMAGESPETVCDDYSITRHELLVACWYEGTHGQYQAEWGKWAADVAYPSLAGWQPLDVDAMPMPPDRSDAGLPADGEERK